MQFHALDDNLFILASSAQKQKKYRCPECLNTVRARGGPHRQLHFYHVKTANHCRQHKKSLTHLHIQQLLQSLLSNQHVFLEQPFAKIGRIADVYWEEQKIVFEVQCSPISAKEVEERCADYKRIGLHPVWILHDRRFNRRYCSAAEAFLRKENFDADKNICSFFTNGKDFFYDQVEVRKGAKRLYQGPPLKVYPERPILAPFLHFEGDRTSRYTPDELKEVEKCHTQTHRTPALKQRVKRFYKSFFHMLLENAK